MSEENYDMSIHHNPDAKAWAEFYKQTFPEADEELMHGWFANAMMAMYDHIQNGEVADLQQQLEQAHARNARLEQKLMAVSASATLGHLNHPLGIDAVIDETPLQSSVEIEARAVEKAIDNVPPKYLQENDYIERLLEYSRELHHQAKG